MKFMVWSDVGNALGAVVKLKAEGNKVAWWCKDPSASSVGKNMVENIHDWKFVPDDETVNVADCTNFGPIFDIFRLGGLPAVGSSLIADRMEMDRAFCKKVMAEAGIPTPKSTFYSDWHRGEEFVRAHAGQRFAIKPGESLSGNLPSHVADKEYPTEDLLGILDHYSRTFAGDPEFELQEFVGGVDLSTAGWFDGQDFLRPCYHTLETKPIMDGDRGATGGCAGNILWPADDWVLEATLYKMVDVLRKYQYRGLIDVNCIVDPKEKKVYALELTPRWGFDSEPAMFTAGIEGELGKFFSDFAYGQCEEFPMKPGFTAGVRMTVPPYPNDGDKAPAGLPILGVSDKDLGDWFYCYDVMKAGDGRLATAGSYGLVGVVCAHGDDARATMQEATDRCKHVRVSEAQYRLDLADVFSNDLKELGFQDTGKSSPAPDAEPMDKPAEKRVNKLFPRSR